jgi:sugar phosphate isomerase/epimerase
MNKISRRQFLDRSALGLGSALAALNMPFSLNSGFIPGAAKIPLGFQVWTLREALVKDFPGTLKMMADLGYKTVEMCSPPGYESSGFAPLMNLKAGEMKKIINDAGLTFESTHYGMDELRKHLSERIDFALESGQKQMIVSSFGLPEKASLNDWKKAATELNEIGVKTKAAGIQTGYHNHHMEFEKIEGSLIYDALLEIFDPQSVKMQFQVAVISIGYKAADYFNKYPGRFISAHLADWSPDKKANVALGKGIVNWKELLGAAGRAGVKNVFVEMDPDTFSASADYYNKSL